MGTYLSREQKKKMRAQRVQTVPRGQALEGRRSSLDREGQQRPWLKAVSSCLGEMTVLGFELV